MRVSECRGIGWPQLFESTVTSARPLWRCTTNDNICECICKCRVRRTARPYHIKFWRAKMLNLLVHIIKWCDGTYQGILDWFRPTRKSWEMHAARRHFPHNDEVSLHIFLHDWPCIRRNGRPDSPAIDALEKEVLNERLNYRHFFQN